MPPGAQPEDLDAAPTPEAPQPLTELDTIRRTEDVAAHLANERTFLAWSFTSLFIMGGGVALARTLIALNTSPLTGGAPGRFFSLFYPTTMGLVFLLAGLVVMILAACRYLSVQEQIIQRRYRPSGIPVMGYLAIVLGLCAILAGFLLELRGNF